jgi:APA family basic amino acid/polyamine antiporter
MARSVDSENGGSRAGGRTRDLSFSEGGRAVRSTRPQSPGIRLDGKTATPDAFFRSASGLVREVSPWHVLAFNVMNGNVGVGLIWVLLLGAGLYPGANLYLSIVIAFVGILPLNMLYARLGGFYARSGGDYTYMTRILHPAVGFAINLAAMVYFALFVGVGGLYTVQYGLAPLASVWAADTGNATAAHAASWLSTTNGELAVSLIVLAAWAAIMIVGGTRRFMRVQTVAFVVGMLALAAIVAVALVVTRASALGRIDATLRHVGAGPLAPLSAGNDAPFSWSATLHAAIWPWIIYLGCYFSVFIGGEVKRPRRTQTIGILGSTSWSMTAMLVVTWAMFHLFGHTFFANLAAAGPAKLGLAATPTFSQLTALALPNTAAALLLLGAFTVWGFAWVGPTAMCVSRCMFAWSLDGLAPKWLAAVHRRWHTPHLALLVIFALAGVFAALLVTGRLTLLSGMSVMVVEWLAVALCAVLLPRVEAPLWETSEMRGSLFGLPTIVWWGLLAIPPVLVVGYLNLSDPNSGTSLQAQPRALLTWLAILGAALVVYFVALVVQHRRGVPVEFAFATLPPE